MQDYNMPQFKQPVREQAGRDAGRGAATGRLERLWTYGP
jgi:hypothetical protein